MMCRSINCMPKVLCTTTLKRVSVNWCVLFIRRVWDTEVTGGEIFFDNKTLPTKIYAGRRTGNLNDNAWGIGGRRRHFAAVQSVLPVNENINVGATVSYMKDIDVRGAKKNAVFGEIGTDII